MTGKPLDVEQFALDDLLLDRDVDGHLTSGGLVQEQPDLARYHIEEVIHGRLSIIEGYASARIDGPTMEAFEECVLRAGGNSFEARLDDEQLDLSTTVVRLGKTLVTQLREPGNADSGPAGIPSVTRYGSEEEARAVFEHKKQALSRVAPQIVVFDKEIEVEWGKFVRVPVRKS